MTEKTEAEWAEEFEHQILTIRAQAIRQVRGVFKTLATMEGLRDLALIHRARGMLRQIRAIVDLDARQDEETGDLKVQIHIQLPGTDSIDVVDLMIPGSELGEELGIMSVSRGEVRRG